MRVIKPCCIHRLNPPPVLLLFCATACQQPESPSNGLFVSASVSSTVVQAGGTVVVQVIATNQGTRALVISDDTCPRPFEISTVQGAVVAAYGDLCSAVASTAAVLSPGESRTTTFQWATDARPTSVAPPVALLPGTYQLRGVIFAAGVRVSSAPVTVTIQ